MAFSPRLAQFVDSAFPTGAFAHSFGLETAAQEGRLRTADDLRAWLLDFLHGSLEPMDGPAVVHASTPGAAQDALRELDRVLYVSRLARETRTAAQKIARQYMRMAIALYPEFAPEAGVHRAPRDDPPAATAALLRDGDPAAPFRRYAALVRRGDCRGHPAIVHGCVCAFLGESSASAVTSYLFTALAAAAASALRATGLGQTQVQQTMASIFPAVEQAAAEILRLAPDAASLCARNVLQEIDAMRHETLYSRLFMS